MEPEPKEPPGNSGNKNRTKLAIGGVAAVVLFALYAKSRSSSTSTAGTGSVNTTPQDLVSQIQPEIDSLSGQIAALTPAAGTRAASSSPSATGPGQPLGFNNQPQPGGTTVVPGAPFTPPTPQFAANDPTVQSVSAVPGLQTVTAAFFQPGSSPSGLGFTELGGSGQFINTEALDQALAGSGIQQAQPKK
jgi:hypothetical protein